MARQKVYLGYDQQSLDAQYNLRARWPQHPEFFAFWQREGDAVRARADCLRRHGRCPRTVAREVSAAPLARRLLRRFVQHARGTPARPGHA